jgi:hypothetical protein
MIIEMGICIQVQPVARPFHRTLLDARQAGEMLVRPEEGTTSTLRQVASLCGSLFLDLPGAGTPSITIYLFINL